MTYGGARTFRATLSTTSGNASKFPNQSAWIEFRNNNTPLPGAVWQ